MSDVSSRAGDLSSSSQQDIKFPSPFDFIKHDFVILIERRMCRSIAEVTEKPHWYEKVFVDNIVDK